MNTVHHQQAVEHKKRPKIKIFRWIVAVLLFVLILFIVRNRENVLLYVKVAVHSWTDYHKEFNFKNARIDSDRKQIELTWKFKGGFTETDLKAATNTYESICELFFEKSDSYEDYSLEIIFENLRMGQSLSLTRMEGELMLRERINVSIGKIADAFPETVFLDAFRLTSESVDELYRFAYLKEVICAYSFPEEEEYLREHYPELCDGER